MKKIIIIGSGGAGKSTLARELGHKMDLPVYHLDALLWKPQWEMTSREEQVMIQEDLFKKESWIIDGNYGGTLEKRIAESDTIIFIDRPRLVCIYQILKRYRQYKHTSRPDMHQDCPEKLDFVFIKWVWNFPDNQRIDILKLLSLVKQSKNVITLRNNKEIELFLSSL